VAIEYPIALVVLDSRYRKTLAGDIKAGSDCLRMEKVGDRPKAWRFLRIYGLSVNIDTKARFVVHFRE
jgi:hypothetical protein